ncbi:MAG: hypothetical protein HC875_29590, partial [Anaerolineales bacterium]|nr:hypothetical protein [Anaerolineales bacterium]
HAGVRPQDLVGAIANETSVPGRDIGAIEIQDRFSLVEVPAGAADDVDHRTPPRRRSRAARATVRRERFEQRPAIGEPVTISAQVARGLPRPRRVRAGLVQPNATTALSERGDFIEVSIADTGPGIPAEDLARIFERFYQVDKSRKRGKGTGLGLTITKEIVEAHGGYIRAESTGGKGTRFIVFLPLTEAGWPPPDKAHF